MSQGGKYNSVSSLNVIIVKMTVKGSSVEKVKQFTNRFLGLYAPYREKKLNELANAQKQFSDCICYLEQASDWKAFFIEKDHTDKIVIELRVLSNYFRNIEDFIDSLLLKKIKINKRDISFNIDQLLPDKNFAPLFVEKKFWPQVIFSILTLGTAIFLSYLRYSEVSEKKGNDLLILIAASNGILFLKTVWELFKYKGETWIKK